MTVHDSSSVKNSVINRLTVHTNGDIYNTSNNKCYFRKKNWTVI